MPVCPSVCPRALVKTTCLSANFLYDTIRYDTVDLSAGLGSCENFVGSLSERIFYSMRSMFLSQWSERTCRMGVM